VCSSDLGSAGLRRRTGAVVAQVCQEDTVAGVNDQQRSDQRPDERKIRQSDDGLGPDEQAYQTMGAGGLDTGYRGAATGDAQSTGGQDNLEIGGARSTGGMPTGAGIGSDIGTIGTSGARGTGTFEAGRSGDVEKAGMTEEGGAIMGSVSGSGAAVGGGAASSGGGTAPVDPTPEQRANP